MNIKEEAVITLLAMSPGEFRNILIGKTRLGRPRRDFHDLSGGDPAASAWALQQVLAVEGYYLPELSNTSSLCFKLLQTIQKERASVIPEVARVLGDYDSSYGEDGDHPPEEEGKELLMLARVLGRITGFAAR